MKIFGLVAAGLVVSLAVAPAAFVVSLGLARASREGLNVLATTQVLTSWSWTTPTLVGSNLYLRDKKTIGKLRLPERASADR